MNAVSVVAKGAGEISLSLLFIDWDLWILFCVLLYVIADAYLYDVLDDPKSIYGMIARRLPGKLLEIALPEAKNQETE